MRLPIPMAGIAMIATALVRLLDWTLAVGILLAADCYLRPGELVGLTKELAIKPQPSLGKEYRFASLHLFPSEAGITSKTAFFDGITIRTR